MSLSTLLLLCCWLYPMYCQRPPNEFIESIKRRHTKSVRGDRSVDDFGCKPLDGTAYNGSLSTTSSGKTCQMWNVTNPPDIQSLGYDYVRGHNYCRDPDGDGLLWCFTTDPATLYDTCDVPFCVVEVTCHSGPTSDYTGNWSTTSSGKTCQAWNATSPHDVPSMGYDRVGGHNFCRDPDGNSLFWCFTTDPATLYDTCDVPLCVLPGIKGTLEKYNI